MISFIEFISSFIFCPYEEIEDIFNVYPCSKPSLGSYRSVNFRLWEQHLWNELTINILSFKSILYSNSLGVFLDYVYLFSITTPSLFLFLSQTRSPLHKLYSIVSSKLLVLRIYLFLTLSLKVEPSIDLPFYVASFSISLLRWIAQVALLYL